MRKYKHITPEEWRSKRFNRRCKYCVWRSGRPAGIILNKYWCDFKMKPVASDKHCIFCNGFMVNSHTDPNEEIFMENINR